MSPETRADCIARLLSAIASADADRDYFAACGEHLKSLEKQAEGMACRRSLARFTAHRPTLIGLDMASGAAPVTTSPGRYRLSTFSLRQVLGLEGA